MTQTAPLMERLSRFKIPRRWRLHRRGHSSTTAHDTPKTDTTKTGTPPTSVIETPKSEEPPTKTQSDIQSKKGSPQEDYFFVPSIDSCEEEQEPNAKLATGGITLPLEECKSLQIRLFNAQLNQTKIMALKAELKQARWDVLMREQSERFYNWELEEAKEELRKLRKKVAISLGLVVLKRAVGTGMAHDMAEPLRLHLLSADKSTCMNETLHFSTGNVTR
ncbi:hypothetical protein INS49_012314 [Diaporthe citri]|uniref:uncharacterized protein n=1 Tax=Diaporthe citri TaxID=83186 RepID=UPI001C8078F2|nr:uncharacterized protein INS49_012314 [Diaporthe citri]KAG6358795.1 hypothetical protein INS49_012314 [Diaporthe citri]